MKITPSKHAPSLSPFGGRGAILLLLWGLGGFSAYAQTTVTLLGEDFATSEVTFSVTMSLATSTWVFVDYTTDPQNAADMSRATFTGVTFTPSGAGTLIDDSSVKRRGFRLESSATVTAKLEGVSGKFSWCAYAISAPPNAVLNPGGGYSLRGTPPFTVNGVELAESATTFGPGTCISSITDFTCNPDGFFPAPPEVTATVSGTTVCAGDELIFTAAASGGITNEMTYTWNITGAGNTITASTTTDTYTTSLTTANTDLYTPYTCTVFVTNANGCTSTVSEAGTVTVYAVPMVTAVSSATICSGLTAALSATASNVTDPATYTWNIQGQSQTTTLTSTYTTPALTTTTATANITYTVKITNATGCPSAAATGTITVHPAFSAGSITTASYKSCNNVAGTATTVPSGGTPTGNGSFSYQWTVSYNAGAAVTISGATLATYTPPATATAGTYRYMRQVKDGLCNTAFTNSAGTVTREVYQDFSAGAITTASTTTLAGTAPNVTVANASSATGGDGNITYQWRRSGTSSATLNGIAATYALSAATSNYSTAGTYYFTRYAMDSACNSAYSLSNGQYTLTVAIPPPYSGTKTWTFGIQTWSGVLSMSVSGCERVSTLSTAEIPNPQYVAYSTNGGYYYNWTCVNIRATTLCSEPWRVPSYADLTYLADYTTYTNLVEEWGTPGRYFGGYLQKYEDSGFMWASDEFGIARRGNLTWDDGVLGANNDYQYYGYVVRCVL